MAQSTEPVLDFRTIKAIRGQSLTIDLGKTFEGDITAWMKRDPEDIVYRSFEVKENRYLFLTKDKAQDFYNNQTLELESKVEGKWYFDVRQLPTGGDAQEEAILLKGIIDFSNNITDSIGNELTEPNYPWATTVIELQDTPTVYGTEGQVLAMNSTVDGVEWVAPAGDKHYSHNQAGAASVWTIVHNLGKHPSASVTDSGGNKVFGDEKYIDLNTMTITFTASFSGRAYLN